VKKTIVIIGATVALVAVGQPAFAWTLGVVDTNDLDTAASLRVSLSDHVWAAWAHQGTDDLFWSAWKATSWKTTQVSGAGTTSACYRSGTIGVALAAGFEPTDGTARIASACYTANQNPATIRWTYRDASTNAWRTDTIAQVPSGPGTCPPGNAQNLGLAFDPSTGAPSIAFGDNSTQAIYWLHLVGSSWVLDQVASLGGSCVPSGPLVSITFDPVGGEPMIAWDTLPLGGGDIDFSTYSATTNSWTSETVVSGVAIDAPSLAITSAGTPWIAFAEGSVLSAHLEAARGDGGTWTTYKVDSVSGICGREPSLALKGDLPRIASYDQTNGNLRWAAYSGSSWSRSTIDSANDVGADPALAFSSTGLSYVADYDVTNKDIRWARPG
jgi:hypothetical protein